MLTNPINSAVDKVYCLVFKPQYFGRKLYNSLVHGCTNINMHEKLDLHATFSVFTKHVHVKMDLVQNKQCKGSIPLHNVITINKVLIL